MTPLAQQLKARQYQFEADTPAEMLEVLSRSLSLLQAENTQHHALSTGSMAPNFTLTSTEGEEIELAQVLSQGPCILTFFRGGWCPYCVLELSAWQALLKKHPQVQLLAVTPESTSYAETTRQAHQLNFPILTDTNNSLTRAFGLQWQLDEEIKALLHKWQINLPQRHDNKHYELPVPATYVINQNRLITYSFIEEDYTLRAEPEEVLQALNQFTDTQ